MHHSAKRAFTLIELLVVIAIIAILAAILFPVFAQAKAAAKAANSISNVKQQMTAVIMYAGDADDLFVPVQTNGSESGSYPFAMGKNVTPWTKLIFPYTKNSELYLDPLGPRTPNSQGTMNLQDLQFMFPRYGFNLYGLNEMLPDGPSGRPTTLPANPAETVMITSRSGSLGDANQMNIYVYATYAPSPHILASPPVSPFHPLLNWGKNNFWSSDIQTVPAGKYTSGIAFRASGNAVVGYVDSHVNKKKPAALAAGTVGFRFDETGTNMSTTSQISLATDPSERAKYLWDIE